MEDLKSVLSLSYAAESLCVIILNSAVISVSYTTRVRGESVLLVPFLGEGREGVLHIVAVA